MRLLWFLLLAVSAVSLLFGSNSEMPFSEAPPEGRIWGEFILLETSQEGAADWSQQDSSSKRSEIGEPAILLRVCLSEFGNQAATQVMVSCLSHVLRADSSLYVEIRYDQPSKYDQSLNYSTVEEIYKILVDRGLHGRVLTRHQSGVDVDKPEIIVARRDYPVAETSVPTGVVELAEKFLVGCVKRDKRAVELFSSRVRGTFSDEELRAFVLGTSNPHHHGYFIHSAAPHEQDWSVVVSLYDHYTGHNLNLDPEKNKYSFIVVREEDEYVVDSLAFVEAEAIQLLEDDTLYYMRLVRHHTWGNSYLPLQCVFTVHAGGQLLYRLA